MKSLTHPRFKDVIATRLIHRCTVSPVQTGAVDDFNVPIKSYPTTIDDVHCLYQEIKTLVTPEEGPFILDKPNIIFNADQAIKAGDKITNIKNLNGDIINTEVNFVSSTTKEGFGIVYLIECDLVGME